MSFNLGSEHKCPIPKLKPRLTPMSFNLGSELKPKLNVKKICLKPTSIQLGSEPLFPNLYLIVT